MTDFMLRALNNECIQKSRRKELVVQLFKFLKYNKLNAHYDRGAVVLHFIENKQTIEQTNT